MYYYEFEGKVHKHEPTNLNLDNSICIYVTIHISDARFSSPKLDTDSQTFLVSFAVSHFIIKKWNDSLTMV